MRSKPAKQLFRRNGKIFSIILVAMTRTVTTIEWRAAVITTMTRAASKARACEQRNSKGDFSRNRKNVHDTIILENQLDFLKKAKQYVNPLVHRKYSHIRRAHRIENNYL